MFGFDDIRRHFIELHRQQRGRLVFQPIYHAGFDGVIDFQVVKRRRLHADRAEDFGLDRRAHHAHQHIGQVLHCVNFFFQDHVARAAAGIAQNPDAHL